MVVPKEQILEVFSQISMRAQSFFLSLLASKRRSNPFFEIASVASLPRNDKRGSEILLPTSEKEKNRLPRNDNYLTTAQTEPSR